MSSAELEEAYGDHLDPMVRDGLVAAYYLAVEKNGSIEVDRGLGAKGAIDVPDPDKNTTFALFSLSKPIVSVAVLKLVDQGLIDLDAPLSRYLNEFQNLKLKNGKTVESQPKIINLFTHTAGFSHNKDFRGKSELSEAYQSKGLFTLKSMVTADTKVNALAIHVNQLAEMPLSSSPGSQFEYSVSTDVLGRLAEVVSGKRLDVFLEEALFGPLGMKDTGFYLEDKNRINKATLMKPLIRTFPVPGTYQRFEPHPPFVKGGSQNLGQEVGLLSGGAGLLSTGQDMIAFASFILNRLTLKDGSQFLSENLTSRLFTNELSSDLGSSPMALKMPYAASDGLSLGFSLRPKEAGDWELNNSRELDFLYWSGFSSSVLWIDPDNEVAGVFLSQIRPAQQFPVAELDNIADRIVDSRR